MMEWLRKRMPKLPSYPDPRDESPEDAQKRLTKLEWGVHAVGRKIERVYGITIELSDGESNRFHDIGKSNAKYWLEDSKHEEVLKNDPALREKIATAIETSTVDYFRAFSLQKKLLALPEPKENRSNYGKANVHRLLFSIYANHLTNATEARFIALGIDPLKAHRINGYIIRNTIDVVHEEINPNAYLDPAQKNTKSDLKTIEQVDRLRGYWTRRHEELNHIIHPPER